MSKQLVLSLPSERNFSRENFLVSNCNFEAVEQISEPENWSKFALIIYGEAGCGKTHLANIWQKSTQAALLVSLPNPRNFFVGQQQKSNLLLEDVEELLCKPKQRTVNEEKLLHLLNLCDDERLKLLITAKTSPPTWGVQLPDLRSRLVALPAAKIYPPGITFLGRLIEKLLQARGINVQNGLGHYLSLRIPRSFAAAHQMVAILDKESLRLGRSATIDLAKKALAELESSKRFL